MAIVVNPPFPSRSKWPEVTRAEGNFILNYDTFSLFGAFFNFDSKPPAVRSEERHPAHSRGQVPLIGASKQGDVVFIVDVNKRFVILRVKRVFSRHSPDAREK